MTPAEINKGHYSPWDAVRSVGIALGIAAAPIVTFAMTLRLANSHCERHFSRVLQRRRALTRETVEYKTMGTPYPLFLIIAALTWWSSSVLHAEPVQPAELLRQAARDRVRSVVIPAGTYRLLPGIAIHGAQDLDIVAEGVTFIFTSLSRGITIDHCSNVTLHGLTIDYDPLPFTQGKVIRVAADLTWVDVRLDEGYPKQAYARVDICDPKTRRRKRGMPFLWGTQTNWAGDGIVRLSRKDIGKSAVIGDLISLSTGPIGGAPHGIAIDFCDRITLRDITLHAAPGMGIIECDGEGNAHYDKVRIVPGPKPSGATSERLLSTSWDAMQSKVLRRGPLVENCEIRHAGDDSWSVQSGDYVVLKSEGKKITVAFRDGYCDGPQAGDRLRSGGGNTEAMIVSREKVNQRNIDLPMEVRQRLATAEPWSFWKLSEHTLEITLSGDSPFVSGQSVYCPDRMGSGYIFRKNKVQSPGRGVLLKAGCGLIEENQFADCHAAVTVSAELPDKAASGIEKIVIRNNVMSGTGYFCSSYNSPQAGAVSVTASDCPISEVAVENNTFRDINGVSLCFLGVNGVGVKGNRFLGSQRSAPPNTGEKYGVDQCSVVYADWINSMSITGNIIASPGPFMKRPLSLGKKVERVSGVSDGLRVD